MMPAKPWTPRELSALVKLWPTAVTDKALEERFGRHRGVIRRTAEERLHLMPSRRLARAVQMLRDHPVVGDGW